VLGFAGEPNTQHSSTPSPYLDLRGWEDKGKGEGKERKGKGEKAKEGLHPPLRGYDVPGLSIVIFLHNISIFLF